EHRLGFLADRLDDLLAVRPALVADRDDGGLVEDDALASHVDEGVGGSEVDREIGGEVAAQGREHWLRGRGAGWRLAGSSRSEGRASGHLDGYDSGNGGG